MKKIKILSLIVAGAMIVMFSCTKENSESIKQTTPSGSNLSQQDIKVNNLIKNFKEKIAWYKANPDLKDGETVPADSALWYLEATINYSHAFPNEYYSDFEIDTSYLTVPVNGDGTVDMSTLTQKYEEMKTNVAADYHNSQFTEKGLSFVTLSQAALNGDELIITVETATGNKNNETPPNPIPGGPFEPGDDWWYGENAGKCSEQASDSFDAAQRLWDEAQSTIPDPNGNYTFVGPFIEKTIKGGPDEFRYPYDIEDNHLDYYLFYATTEIGPCGDDTLCVEWPEMNHYFQRLKYLMYHYFLDKPEMEDYDIMCILDFDDFSDQYGVYMNFYHMGHLKFGIKIYYTEGDGPEEI